MWRNYSFERSSSSTRRTHMTYLWAQMTNWGAHQQLRPLEPAGLHDADLWRSLAVGGFVTQPLTWWISYDIDQYVRISSNCSSTLSHLLGDSCVLAVGNNAIPWFFFISDVVAHAPSPPPPRLIAKWLQFFSFCLLVFWRLKATRRAHPFPSAVK